MIIDVKIRVFIYKFDIFSLSLNFCQFFIFNYNNYNTEVQASE